MALPFPHFNKVQLQRQVLGVMTMMMTSSTSLEKQVAFLAKSVKSLAANMKKKDEQIAFIMEKITILIGEKPTTSNQNQFPSLQEECGNLANEVSQKQEQQANKVVTPRQLKELIKKAIKDQNENVIQPSYTYIKPYSQRINHLRIPQSY